MGEIDGIEVMVNRTGYTGEPGVELMCPAEDAPALWDAVVARGAVPVRPRRTRHAAARGLLPAARERHHAGHRRDLRRPRLDVRAREGLHAASRRCGASRRRGRSGGSSPFVMDEKAIPRQGMPIARRRRGHVGHALADARQGDRDGLRRRLRCAAPGTELTIDVRGKRPPRDGRAEADLQARGLSSGRRRELPRRPASTTPSTTGPASRATRPCSGSRGSRRTRSASSSTSRRPTRARP